MTMTRRSVLSLLAALPVLSKLTSASEPARTIVGPMTLDRERMLRSRGVMVRVFVNGEEVSRRCQFADDTPGHQVARLLKHGPNGRPYFDHETGEVARETVTTGVTMTLEKMPRP